MNNITDFDLQDCPEGTPDFRLEQCQQYNNVSFGGSSYQWVPFYGGTLPMYLDLNFYLCLLQPHNARNQGFQNT